MTCTCPEGMVERMEEGTGLVCDCPEGTSMNAAGDGCECPTATQVQTLKNGECVENN